jgi:hypothetical protein
LLFTGHTGLWLSSSAKHHLQEQPDQLSLCFKTPREVPINMRLSTTPRFAMPHTAPTDRHRMSRLVMAVSLAAVLGACGGGGSEAPAPRFDPSPVIDVAPLVLTYEQQDDGTYALFQVNVHSGVKVTLDQGAKAPYTGRIIGERAFFVRALTVDEATGAVADSDLLSVRLDGADMKRLTSGPERDHRMLPMGDRLVFSRVRYLPGNQQTSDVMSARLDGSDLRELAADPDLNELVMVESAGDVVVIQATANGKQLLSTRRADGSLPAVPIAGVGNLQTFRALVGDRMIFTTPGKVFSSRLDGGGLVELFGQEGERYFNSHLGNNVLATERVNGGPTEHLHLIKADGSGKVSPLAVSSWLAGVAPGEPDRLFLDRFAGGKHEFLVLPIGAAVGASRLLSTSDRFTWMAAIEGDAVIARRDRDDDPDITLSSEIVSLRETPAGVVEVLLASRVELGYGLGGVVGSTEGRLVLNNITGMSVGWPLITYFAISPDGTDSKPLVQDAPGLVHESLQVRKDGQVIFRRSEYTVSDAKPLGSELLSVRVADGRVVRLSHSAKSVGLVPSL